jgi:hypothetical protein
MAIFGNFKGTTQSEFRIGKSSAGNKISTNSLPESDLTAGDLHLDSSNSTLQVYNNAWVNIGSTLPELNVDNGTLFVDSSNDTVSVGSTTSNDKMFVNGSLRLGTNPSLKHSGAYLDVSHTNGSATQLRIRDNESSGNDPIFKIYDANNTSEVFKVQGNTTTFSGEATLTGIDTLRINENGTGLRMTNVGAFDNSGGDFRIFSTSNLILSTNGDSGTAVTFDQTTKDAVFQGNVTVNNAYTLPSADGSNKQVMTSDGAGAVSFTSLNVLADTFVGGSDTYVQFNDDDNFHGVSTFAYNKVTDTLTVPDVSIAGNIVPTANVTYDLGTSTNRFKDLYLSGNTINIGTTSISVTSDNEIDFSDSANTSVKRKLVVDEIEIGTGNDKIVLRKNSDGKFESKAKNRSTKVESSVKVDLDDNDTDDLSEGSTNLYYTDARANSAIDAKLTGDITLGNVTSQSTNTGVVEGVVFQPITDYGSITNTANITIDYGRVSEAGTVPAIGDFEYLVDTFGPTGDSFTVSSLPSAAQPGQMIYVSDETAGSVMAFSDGSNWRRITDRAIVS